MGRKKPIEKDLFTIPSSPGEEPHLIGSKCTRCGEVLFPKQPICPKCSNESLSEVALGRKGRVYSSTILHYQPPLYKGPMPIPQGRVELPEGVLVPAIFTECDTDNPLEIGLEVEMIFGEIGEDQEGNEIVTYKFRPVTRR